ncbi:oligosaccharide flippase family protein [Vibrio navarrensis]|uniref:oligosaccharide flippase family protein n=1 Tax=Vibrio navarrensis TaxID=29495 RepID=UPI00338F00A8
MIQFFLSFLRRGGGLFFLSSIFNKLLFLLLPVVMIRMVPLSEYGDFEFAKTLVFLLTPFYCMGIHEALLRFGALKEKDEEIKQLFSDLFIPSITASILVAIVVFNIGISGYLSQGISANLIIMSFYIISNGMLLFVSNYYRSRLKNNTYSFIIALNSLLFCFFYIIFYYLDFEYFASVSLALSSFLSVVFFIDCKPQLKLSKIELRRYVSYGIYIGLGGIVSQLALALDILMIGLILDDSEIVATYKVITLLPSFILFFSSILIKSDFAHITKIGLNNVATYYFKYTLSLFIPFILVVSIMLLYLDQIFINVFTISINETIRDTVVILFVGCFFSCFIRIPLGNILNALGEARFNVVNGVFALILNLILNYLLLESFGMIGASIATTLSLFSTSFLMMIYFRKILKKRN